MIIGKYNLDENKTHVMGILNITPDSFSDGGRYNSMDNAIRHALQMEKEGAAIIDIGGESTRPGYTMISDEEEIDRVCPVIERLKKEIDIPISLDTYKSNVAREGLKCGVDLINDIWGLKYDKNMAGIIAKYSVPCCLMHNRNNMHYNDFMKDIMIDLQECVDLALAGGIDRDKIILDPGVGFAKEYEHNILCIKNIADFNKLGYPVLLGTSRKSVIGLTLDLPKDERLEGTLVTTVIAVINKCMFVRVHDVKENYRVIKMTEGIYG